MMVKVVRCRVCVKATGTVVSAGSWSTGWEGGGKDVDFV